MATRQLDATTADFLAELVNNDVGEAVTPDEFTIKDYMAEYERQTGKRIAKSTAELRLESRVKRGELTRRLVRIPGAPNTRAYKQVDGTEENLQFPS